MRRATIARKTAETEIEVSLNLDGTGTRDIATGIGFFDHMLDQLACHSMIDMVVRCEGDTHIDDHHSVEDTGIALGQALAEALGDKTLPTAKIGSFDTELVREFFQAFSSHGGITLNIAALSGINSHHMVEAAFKAVARALREAVEPDPRAGGAVPSTKGTL